MVRDTRPPVDSLAATKRAPMSLGFGLGWSSWSAGASTSPKTSRQTQLTAGTGISTFDAPVWLGQDELYTEFLRPLLSTPSSLGVSFFGMLPIFSKNCSLLA